MRSYVRPFSQHVASVLSASLLRRTSERATCLPLERGVQREARGARHLGVGELGRRAHHLDLDPGMGYWDGN